MTHDKSMCAEHDMKHKRYCVSWSAIVIGALVGIGLGFLLNLFSASIGLALFTTSPEGATTLAIGGLIGTLIGTIAIMYTMGWVAGFIARPYCFHRKMGALYGFGSWTLALIISMLLLNPVSEFISANYYSLIAPNALAKMNPQQEMKAPMGEPAKNAQNAQNAPNAQNAQNAQAEANAKKTPATANLGATGGVATSGMDEKIMKALEASVLYTFILFFIAALASCFGGYFGACGGCKHKDEEHIHRKEEEYRR